MRPSKSFGLGMNTPLLRRCAPLDQAAVAARRLGPGRVLSMQREGQSLAATVRAPSGAPAGSTLAERAERAVQSTSRPLGGLARGKVGTARTLLHACTAACVLSELWCMMHGCLQPGALTLAMSSGCCTCQPPWCVTSRHASRWLRRRGGGLRSRSMTSSTRRFAHRQRPTR
jgi:hypothetical protein